MGVGLGGFIDGILFHQIFQTHGMLTAKYPNETIANSQINESVWDYVFLGSGVLFIIIGWMMIAKAKYDGAPPRCGAVFMTPQEGRLRKPGTTSETVT